MTTTKKATWPLILLAVAAAVAYVHAHPVSTKPATVTVPQGTNLEVRLERSVGSKTSSSGESFSGKLAQPITIDGQVLIPAGTEFSGTVLQAVPAGRIAGGASLQIALNSFSMNDKDYAIQTAPIVRVSKGQGKRTAEYAGGGAALGAAIGALAHGRKGALIGAGVGAGAGAAGSAATTTAHDIVMPATSVLTFHMTQQVVLTPTKPEPQPHDLLASIRSLFS